MNNFLFFNYAKLKGYRFELVEKSNTNHLGNASEEHTIFAFNNGRMVGAVQLKDTILPQAICKEMGLRNTAAKYGESLLISMFFINSQTDLRTDIIITGLLLKLQKYAGKSKFCLGYSYDTFCQGLSNNKMKLFDLDHEQLAACPVDAEAVIKHHLGFQVNNNDLFVWDTGNTLLKFNPLKKGKKHSEVSRQKYSLSNAA